MFTGQFKKEQVTSMNLDMKSGGEAHACLTIGGQALEALARCSEPRDCEARSL